jgi:hypothetical protein
MLNWWVSAVYSTRMRDGMDIKKLQKECFSYKNELDRAFNIWYILNRMSLFVSCC